MTDKLSVSDIVEKYSLDKSLGYTHMFSFKPETGEIGKIISRPNKILYSAADILAKLIAGVDGYNIGAMYLEYKNVDAPGDPITAPTFTRGGGIDYYNGLASSEDVDFLRIPLTISPLITSSGSDYAGNTVTFYGISEGTVGFNGKPFTAAANSSVYGAGLISVPNFDSQDEDLVFSRVYAGAIDGWTDYIPKENGFEIGVTWSVRFN